MTIRILAVLGAGTMGRGIAHVAALAGYDTRLFDPLDRARDDARATIHRNLDKGVSLGKIAADAAAGAKDRLRLEPELAGAVAGADLVIEAAPESMALKTEAFREVARHAPAEAYFATNTSALSVTEMAGATDRPERFAGMHFFTPAHVMKLLELVRGLQTSPETVAALRAAGERMGKEVVVGSDSSRI